MFKAVLFTIVKCWKQPKCPSINEWIKKLWYIYTMEYYAAERKKEVLPFVTKQNQRHGNEEQTDSDQRGGGRERRGIRREKSGQ